MKRKLFIILIAALMLASLATVAIAGAEVDVDTDTQAFLDAWWTKSIKDGHIDFWTIEERYEFEQPWVEYILSQEDDIYRNALYGLPDENDIKQDEAREIAKDAVKQEFGDNAFNDGREWDRESVYFFAYFTGEHEWRFGFYSKANDSKDVSIPYYEAWIDAKTGEVNKVFAHTDAPAENAVSAVQTTSELIDLWINQYPLNFDVTNLDSSDVDNKLHMDMAMKIALDYILDTYDFTFDQLKESSPQVIFSDTYHAWLVHIVPRNPVDTFSINVDYETGVITYTRYGAPTG